MDHKMRDELQDVIQVALDHGFAAGHIATSLVNAGYRLDPYPDGKSKDELIKRIEELDPPPPPARGLLHSVHSRIKQDATLLPGLGEDISRFLADTSTVKQPPELDDGATREEVRP